MQFLASLSSGLPKRTQRRKQFILEDSKVKLFANLTWTWRTTPLTRTGMSRHFDSSRYRRAHFEVHIQPPQCLPPSSPQSPLTSLRRLLSRTCKWRALIKRTIFAGHFWRRLCVWYNYVIGDMCRWESEDGWRHNQVLLWKYSGATEGWKLQWGTKPFKCLVMLECFLNNLWRNWENQFKFCTVVDYHVTNKYQF